MKKFKFKLQAVLDYRAEQLDLAKQALAKEETLRQTLVKNVAEYDQLIAQAFVDQQVSLAQRGLVDIAQAQSFPQYIWRLKQLRFEQFQKLQAQERVIEARRHELKQAMIKHKSLELLKEKAERQFIKRVEKAEEDILAEIALNKIARRTLAQNALKQKAG